MTGRATPIRFQGQQEDAETGLFYHRFRDYDPATGLYISPDPIGLAGGLQRYAYVPGPLGWNDPFGLAARDDPRYAVNGLVRRAADEQLLRPENHALLLVESDPVRLVERFRAQTPPAVESWLRSGQL